MQRYPKIGYLLRGYSDQLRPSVGCPGVTAHGEQKLNGRTPILIYPVSVNQVGMDDDIQPDFMLPGMVGIARRWPRSAREARNQRFFIQLHTHPRINFNDLRRSGRTSK